MPGTHKSILVKSNANRKTKKNVRIYSPGNQTFEFKRKFKQEDINNLWSNSQDLRNAKMSTEDKILSKATPEDHMRRKKRHIHSIQMKENGIFNNRKKAAKEAALKARQLLGITDIVSPSTNSTRTPKKKVRKIIWPSSPVISVPQDLFYYSSLNKSRKYEPEPEPKSKSKSKSKSKPKPKQRSTLKEREIGKQKAESPIISVPQDIFSYYYLNKSKNEPEPKQRSTLKEREIRKSQKAEPVSDWVKHIFGK